MQGHVVWCSVVWCGVVWCGVVWCGVVWCGVVWCGVVWCGVVWCGVVWCGVVWCGRQWPGCLPTGTGKRAGLCVLCARRVYVCRSWRREGEPGRPGRLALGDRSYSRSPRCTPSRSACWCRRSSCNALAIVLPGPRRAFSSVARALAWAYQTRMDPGGPAALRGSAGLLPSAPAQPAPIAGGAPGPLVVPPSGRATLRAAGGPAPIHGIEPSRPTGGALFRVALRKGGTWYPAPCPGGRNGGLGLSSSGRCPFGAP